MSTTCTRFDACSYRSLLLIVLLTGLFSGSLLAQSKLFMNPIRYTDRRINTYRHVCGDPKQIHFTLNGRPFPPYEVVYFANGLCFIQFEFGLLKPGDVVRVSDDCGSVPFQTVVQDDYTYVEVPGGAGHSGNGIGPDDASPPYSRLSTPLAVGPCEPVKIGAHVLVRYFVFLSSNAPGQTRIGPLTVNGSTFTEGAHSTSDLGDPNPSSHSVGPDGSVNYEGTVKFTSNQQYSGSTPLAIVYKHNGAPVNGDFSIGIGAENFGAINLRYISNTGFSVEKATYTSDVSRTDFTGDYTNATFKVTYDGAWYKVYVDGTAVDSLRRFVIYDASGGSLTQQGSVLPYGSSVTYTPGQPGSQWVSALIDGVMYTRQQFSVSGGLSVQATASGSACAGPNAGSITVTASGGQGPYRYALGQGPFGSSNTFGNLAGGTYTVRVRDAGGCETATDVTVGAGNLLVAAVKSKTAVKCFGGADGSVSITTDGSVPSGPLRLSIDNGKTFQNSPDFGGLAAGTYTVEVRDNACSTSVPFTIDQPADLSTAGSVTRTVSCFKGADGVVAVNATGGVAPYQFAPTGGSFAASPVFGGLAAGSYAFQVKDANGCLKTTAPVALTEPEELLVPSVTTLDVRCAGGADGSIRIIPSGGTGPYTYAIDANAFQASATIGGLSAGTYTARVQDSRGCISFRSVTIGQPIPLTLTVSGRTPVTCRGGADGTVQLQAAGGLAPYTYAVDNGPFGASNAISSLKEGTYAFRAQDRNGCNASISQDISFKSALKATVEAVQAVRCFGGSDGGLTIRTEESVASGPLRFSIDQGKTVQASPRFDQLPAGTYTIQVLDDLCSVPVSVTVSQPTEVAASAAVTRLVSCFRGNDGEVAVTASGGVSPYRYSINGTDYGGSAVFSNLASDSYKFWVQDANGCLRTTSLVSVGQPTELQASILRKSDIRCHAGAEGSFELTASGGTAPYRFGSAETNLQPDAVLTGLKAGSYTLVVQDGNGCRKTVAGELLQPAAPFTVTLVSQANLRCFEDRSGRLEFRSTGGTAPYLLSLDNQSFQEKTVFDGLSARSYKLYGKDAHDCPFSLSGLTLSQPAEIRVRLLRKLDVDCEYYQRGEALAAAEGGTGGFTYHWNGTGFAGQPTASASGESGLFTQLVAGN
ncbi:SprB repeat-containing protein [Larkinella soli]|uniref:SprB repeat-containing protein n=1 Tax=Larkinella soli TaxID=1770527 RepID=UPI000FFB5E4E|nr:SprB repeat-containing protein [Larkinella soli]